MKTINKARVDISDQMCITSATDTGEKGTEHHGEQSKAVRLNADGFGSDFLFADGLKCQTKIGTKYKSHQAQ